MSGRVVRGICADYCPRCGFDIPHRDVRCQRCGEVIHRA